MKVFKLTGRPRGFSWNWRVNKPLKPDRTRSECIWTWHCVQCTIVYWVNKITVATYLHFVIQTKMQSSDDDTISSDNKRTVSASMQPRGSIFKRELSLLTLLGITIFAILLRFLFVTILVIFICHPLNHCICHPFSLFETFILSSFYILGLWFVSTVQSN